MALRNDTTFGPYRIVGPLGKGGMASVYKVYQADLDRYVALKVLPAEFLHDDTFSERFRREAKVIARLEHPHIVPIHAFGIDEGIPWMAMRLVAGGTVAALLKDGPLEPDRTIRILEDVAEALDYAHEKGIVHRDVKPPNILLDEADRAYLADFGVARMREGSTLLTAAGMVTGTPQYMAPEQARAGTVDHRCDIYALGVVAYEMLSGRVPFTADTPLAVLMRQLEDPVPVPQGLAEPVVAVLVRCLAKRPEDRWPKAREFVHALRDSMKAPLPAVSTGHASTPAPAPQAALPGSTQGSRGRNLPRIPPVAAGAALLALALSAVVAVRHWSHPSTAEPTPSPSRPAESPSPLAEARSPEAAKPVPSARPEVPRAGAASESHAGDVRASSRDGLEYAFVPPVPGVLLGCVPGDKDCYPDEKPAHRATLSHGYWFGRTEVTVGAYKRFSASSGRSMPTAPASNAGWGTDDRPIVYVTWADAEAYCAWSGGRLPTEAEWEYAARGGAAGGKYPWGNASPVCRKGAANGAKFDDGGACKPAGPDPVASYRPNGFGLYDVSGNVWEWCSDWYGAKSYAAERPADPVGPAAGVERVLRGGAFNSNLKGIRVSLRNHLVPVSRSVFVGLRCARDAAP